MGVPAVLLRGIPGKALRAFPGSFRNFSRMSSGKSQLYWGCGLCVYLAMRILQNVLLCDCGVLRSSLHMSVLLSFRELLSDGLFGAQEVRFGACLCKNLASVVVAALLIHCWLVNLGGHFDNFLHLSVRRCGIGRMRLSRWRGGRVDFRLKIEGGFSIESRGRRV